jgi:hypothetical protein
VVKLKDAAIVLFGVIKAIYTTYVDVDQWMSGTLMSHLIDVVSKMCNKWVFEFNIVSAALSFCLGQRLYTHQWNVAIQNHPDP